MSKCILVFLSVAATAAGQDVVLESTDVETLWSTIYEPSHPLGQAYSLDSFQWNVQRQPSRPTGESTNRRASVTFRIPQDASYSSATLMIPLGLGTTTHMAAETVITLHDVAKDNTQAEEYWDDLGSGAFYGTYDVTPERFPEYWPIRNEFISPIQFHAARLSPLAVRDIQNGGFWTIGAALPVDPLSPNAFTRISQAYNEPFLLLLDYGPPPPLGDFDGSGRVDQADLDFVLLNWGLVDQEELDAVLLTWGHSTPLAASAIPEPPTMPLAAACVIMAAIGSLSWSRRKCRH